MGDKSNETDIDIENPDGVVMKFVQIPAWLGWSDRDCCCEG